MEDEPKVIPISEDIAKQYIPAEELKEITSQEDAKEKFILKPEWLADKGYVITPRLLLYDNRLSRGAKLLGVILIDCCFLARGFIFKRKDLTLKNLVDVRDVETLISYKKELHKVGFLTERIRVGGRCNTYIIDLDNYAKNYTEGNFCIPKKPETCIPKKPDELYIVNKPLVNNTINSIQDPKKQCLELLSLFTSKYKEFIHKPYHIKYGQDNAHIKSIMNTYGFEETKRIIEVAFLLKDENYYKFREEISIGLVRSALPAIVERLAKLEQTQTKKDKDKRRKELEDKELDDKIEATKKRLAKEN